MRNNEIQKSLRFLRGKKLCENFKLLMNIFDLISHPHKYLMQLMCLCENFSNANFDSLTLHLAALSPSSHDYVYQYLPNDRHFHRISIFTHLIATHRRYRYIHPITDFDFVKSLLHFEQLQSKGKLTESDVDLIMVLFHRRHCSCVLRSELTYLMRQLF